MCWPRSWMSFRSMPDADAKAAEAEQAGHAGVESDEDESARTAVQRYCTGSGGSVRGAAGKRRVCHTARIPSGRKSLRRCSPYDETDDQLADDRGGQGRTWRAPRSWIGLICGDVGYGKTEIAIRAAFKAVQEGKQVVVSGADHDPGAAALQYVHRSA